MPLTGLCLALLAVAALTGWLDRPLQRLRLRPAGAALACAVLLAATGQRWRLPLTPLARWLAPGAPHLLALDPGAYLLPLALCGALALREGGPPLRRALLATALVGAGLTVCFIWLPGEPAQTPLLDPSLLYAVAGGLAASLAACSAAGAIAAATWSYGIAELGRAVVALWLGTPVLTLGGDPGRPLLLAALVAMAAAELVYETRTGALPALPRRRSRPQRP